MIEFVRRTGLKLIQMRNLNIDPESYLSIIPKAQGEIYGMKQMIEIFEEELPDVVIGLTPYAEILSSARRSRL